ncbi:alpha/beta-hydrolase [Lophium mytilinum]|uniref:Alpha/beta-hydrolase n=1 Tax=Lophium mytilinum TaxID=390894 RepID=A0A6A6R3V4_9PEZI|nr:alpha/beta-hydrolase [Lophium mytilinum]
MKINGLVAIISLAGSTYASNYTVGQTVDTGSGSVVGHAAPIASAVSEYLGIPYAQPPVKNLRFAPPLAYTGNSTINASAFGPSCTVAKSNALSASNSSTSLNLTAAGRIMAAEIGETGLNLTLSEDCLTMNVWTKPQTGDAKKAVLVWMYGGFYTIGSSAIPLYNGQFIADQEDVVVVTINYRVNIWGFPSSPTLPQNVGLLDQRLALEWIRQNIAAFAGDPSRITLMGQSAGAGSADLYSYKWTEDPIVNAFIMESGTTEVVVPLNASTGAEQWFNVSASLGCGGADTEEAQVLACMRQVNSSALASSLGSNSFSPTIDNTLVFDNYTARAAAGDFIKKPLLIGNNNNEPSVFRLIALAKGEDLPDAYWQAVGLKTFDCPCAARANVSIFNKVPTWRYRFFGVFPDTNLTTNPDSGAYHGSEIPMIFGVPPAGQGIANSSQQELALMSYMRGAWTTFAKDPVAGLSRYEGGWPSYDPAQDTLIRLGFGEQTGTNVGLAGTYDAPCGTLFSSISGVGNGKSSGNGTLISNTSSAGVGSAPCGYTATINITFDFLFNRK